MFLVYNCQLICSWDHSNLTSWAENGVLLLNTALTVRASAAGSHSNQGWEDFTDKVVEIVDRFGGANLGSKDGVAAGRGRGIVFLAWGAWAGKRVAKLDKVRALPSPLFLVSIDKLSMLSNCNYIVCRSDAQKKHLILTSAVSDSGRRLLFCP